MRHYLCGQNGNRILSLNEIFAINYKALIVCALHPTLCHTQRAWNILLKDTQRGLWPIYFIHGCVACDPHNVGPFSPRRWLFGTVYMRMFMFPFTVIYYSTRPLATIAQRVVDVGYHGQRQRDSICSVRTHMSAWGHIPLENLFS